MLEWLQSRRYPLILAVICGAVLALGMLLKPAKQAEEATISPADLQALARRSVRQRLDELSRHFQTVGEEVVPYVVALENASLYGVVWNSDGLVLAAKPPPPLPQPLTVSFHRIRRQNVELVWGPRELPLIALKTSLKLRAPQRVLAESIDPGSWLLLVAQRPDRSPLIVPAIFSGQRLSSCGSWSFHELQVNSPIADDVVGAGAFTLDDALAGMVLRCRGRQFIVAVEDLQNVLKRSESPADRLVDEFGMRLSPLNDASMKHFAVNAGALVTEVWDDSAADLAGIIPGDILREIEGEAVTDAHAAIEKLLGGFEDGISLKVQRHGRILALQLRNDAAPASPATGGITIAQPQSGVTVREVNAGSRAARAGIRPGDLLLNINGYPLTPDSRRLALLQGEKTAFVVFRRNDRTFGVLLP